MVFNVSFLGCRCLNTFDTTKRLEGGNVTIPQNKQEICWELRYSGYMYLDAVIRSKLLLFPYGSDGHQLLIVRVFYDHWH